MFHTVAGLPPPPTSMSPRVILVMLPGEEIEYWTSEAVSTTYKTAVFFKVPWRDGDQTWFEWSLEDPRATSRGRLAC